MLRRNKKHRIIAGWVRKRSAHNANSVSTKLMILQMKYARSIDFWKNSLALYRISRVLACSIIAKGRVEHLSAMTSSAWYL